MEEGGQFVLIRSTRSFIRSMLVWTWWHTGMIRLLATLRCISGSLRTCTETPGQAGVSGLTQCHSSQQTHRHKIRCRGGQPHLFEKRRRQFDCLELKGRIVVVAAVEVRHELFHRADEVTLDDAGHVAEDATEEGLELHDRRLARAHLGVDDVDLSSEEILLGDRPLVDGELALEGAGGLVDSLGVTVELGICRLGTLAEWGQLLRSSDLVALELAEDVGELVED